MLIKLRVFIVLIFCVLFQRTCNEILKDNMHIKNFELFKCEENEEYPVNLENVLIDIGYKSKVVVSGTLRTSVNLISPIKVDMKIKKHIGFWIEVPCEKNLGSCTFEDICIFGYPETKRCPEKLAKYNIPCRCPILKGNYTIPKFNFLESRKSIYSGKYKGTIKISSSLGSLACYNTNFVIVDLENVN